MKDGPKNPAAKLSDLVESIDFPQDSDNRLYFDRQTGETVCLEKSILSAVEEGDEERLEDVPAWQKPEIEVAKAIIDDRAGRFIDPPDKVEFDEYRHMQDFIETIDDPDLAGQLSRSIQGSGAFRRFKDTLYRLRLEKRWFNYRDRAMKEFAIDWAEENNVSYVDDLKGRGKE